MTNINSISFNRAVYCQYITIASIKKIIDISDSISNNKNLDLNS